MTDLALKSVQIVDFCGKSSGLVDFENTVDHGSAVIFHGDSGLCLSYVWILNPKRNLDHRFVSTLMSSSKLFLFLKEVHLNLGVTL